MDTSLAVAIGFLSPFLFKYVPLKGALMVLFTWVAAFGLALGDLYVTGGMASWSLGAVAKDFVALYAVQQPVYMALAKNAPAAVSEAFDAGMGKGA